VPIARTSPARSPAAASRKTTVEIRSEELGTPLNAKSLHEDLVRGRSEGHIFNTISNGIRNMPGYSAQIPVEDRWAIVAYVRALQLSQNAPPSVVASVSADAPPTPSSEKTQASR
jgi:hypothetical protein